VAPVNLRSALSPAAARRVTWLELFYDLIFVAAVSQVAEPLHHHYTLDELLRLVPLLTLIWWAWTGHSFFSTRFHVDDPVQRFLTVVQVFVVAVMAANAQDALASRSSGGFAAAYAALRILLVMQYGRARRLPAARGIATRHAIGHGTAAAIWLASALVPAPARFWLWAVAFLVDLGTPWIAVHHMINVPHNEHHLPERFGLFTIIVFGEAIVAVMKGIESQETWPASAALSAFLSLAMLFMMCCWYFDGAGGASPQPVRSRREAIQLHVWTYAHLPLCVATVVSGVGLNELVASASHTALTTSSVLLLTSSMAVAMLTLALIGAASARGPKRRSGVLQTVVAFLTLSLGLLGLASVPANLALALTAACLIQLGISLSPAGGRTRHDGRDDFGLPTVRA
jgi:low temperature requirement protein LtrA